MTNTFCVFLANCYLYHSIYRWCEFSIM